MSETLRPLVSDEHRAVVSDERRERQPRGCDLPDSEPPVPEPPARRRCGSSVIAAKSRVPAVVSLPPDLQAQVVALVSAIVDELEGRRRAGRRRRRYPLRRTCRRRPGAVLRLRRRQSLAAAGPHVHQAGGGEAEVMQSRSARESNVLVLSPTRPLVHFAQVALRRRHARRVARPRSGHAQPARTVVCAARRRIGSACAWTAGQGRACGAST